jgi:hypothetical protein
MFFLRATSLAAFASLVSAHIDLVYPEARKFLCSYFFVSSNGQCRLIAQGQWPRPDNTTDGAICGGGSRAPAFAWGNESPFVAVNGDAGQLITMRLAISDSTSNPVVPTSEDIFSIVLARDVPLPESGVMCLPVNVGTDYPAGSRALLYVEARDADDTDRSDVDSTCSGKLINCSISCVEILLISFSISTGRFFFRFTEVVLVAANQNLLPVIDHGSPIQDHDTGLNITSTLKLQFHCQISKDPYSSIFFYQAFDYYCSNTTIPALSDCSCHCDGTVGTSCIAPLRSDVSIETSSLQDIATVLVPMIR